jgi:hypothetical protein
MGHRDSKTTEIYADYQPDERGEAEMVERAFGSGLQFGLQFEQHRATSTNVEPHRNGESDGANAIPPIS